MHQTQNLQRCIISFLIIHALQVTSSLVAHAQEDEKKPNLLVIMTDEHNLRTLSCYRDYYLSKFPKDVVDVWGENVFVDTPNIDSLAKEGALFANFYTSVPQCTPARASFLSGLHAFKTGAVENWDGLDADIMTWANVLQNEGYATSYIGKWHLDGDDRIGPYKDINYDPLFFPESGDVSRTFGFGDNKYRYSRGHFKVIKETSDGRFKKGNFIEDMDEGDNIEEVYTTDFYTKRAMEYIQLKDESEQPFALFLSLADPHGPNEVRSPYDTMYNDVPFAMPKTTVNYINSNPPPPGFYGEFGVDYKRKNGIDYTPRDPNAINNYLEEFAEEKEFKSTMRNYFGMVKLIDDKVGDMLSTIKALGIEQNTIICFTSDHGDLSFEHGRLNKEEPFMTSAGVPMIIKYPNHIKPNKVIETAYSHVDFAPSILGIMGLSDRAESMNMVFDGVDGSNEILNQEDVSNDNSKYIISYLSDGRWILALKAGRKLILNGLNKGATMYDLKLDPQEVTNYISKKPMVVSSLYRKIQSWLSSRNFVATDSTKSFINSASYCRDSAYPLLLKTRKTDRTISCKWVSKKPFKRCMKGKGLYKGAIATACPEACKTIMPCSCEDTKMQFMVGQTFMTCSEVTESQCPDIEGLNETCRKTCGQC